MLPGDETPTLTISDGHRAASWVDCTVPMLGDVLDGIPLTLVVFMKINVIMKLIFFNLNDLHQSSKF